MTAPAEITKSELLVLLMAWACSAVIGVAFVLSVEVDNNRLWALALVGPPYFLTKAVLTRTTA